MSSTLIICDIDGVLADPVYRLPFLKLKDYDNFYKPELIRSDRAILSGMELVEQLYFSDDKNELVFVTGRPEHIRQPTTDWLKEYDDTMFYSTKPLYMRVDGDYRPSPIVKVELIRKIIEWYLAEHNHEPDYIYFIDDDPENVKAVCKAFPKITGITFGIKRMEEK